jgi:hypothetical protein
MNHFNRRQKVKNAIKGFVVLLLVLGMAAPVVAEDRLSLSGQMRVRGFFMQQDDDGIDTSHAWNDQRLRIGGKIAVAEGVSVNFRFDASESDENSSNDVAWGGSTSTSYAPYSLRRADIQFDKAYLQVEKMGYTFMAGQQYFGGFGTGHLLDTIGTGFVLKKGDLYLAHVKQYDDNNGNDGFVKTGFNDISVTAASYDIKGDGFSLKPMVSYSLDDGTDNDLLGLGVYGTLNAAGIGFKGEIDYFTGETAGVDDKGFQVYLDGSMAVNDMIKVGAIVLYALGEDTDNQVTYQKMPVFAEWHPENYGPWAEDIPGDVDTFDPTGAGAGVIGFELYSDVKVSDDLGLSFSGLYFQTEEDSVADVDGYVLNANANYAVAKNTKLLTQLNYFSAEDNDSSFEYSQLGVISGLVVSF